MFLDGRRDESIKYFDSVCASAGYPPLGRYFAHSLKSEFHLKNDDYGLAMRYNDSNIALIEQNQLQQIYTKEYVHSLLQRGLIFSNAEKYDSAYNAYMNGYKFVLEKGDNFLRYEFDYHIGMSLYKQNNKAKAREFFLKSLAEAYNCPESEKPWYRIQELLDNIALSTPIDSGGRVFFDSCISFVRHNAHRFQNQEMVANALATAYKNKGNRLLSANYVAEAKDAFRSSFDVYINADSVKYADKILQGKLGLCMALYFAGDADGVIAYWKELKPLVDTIQQQQIKEAWMRVDYMYYEMIKDYKTALYKLIDADEYQMQFAGFFPENNAGEDILLDMKNHEQEYKIQLLTKEKQLQRAYLWGVLALSVIALLVAFLVYRNYKRTQAANQLISNQKMALEASNREKDAILNVVAHDLRNPVGNVVFLADMMLMEGGSSMSQQEAFQMIRASASGALKLSDELLQVARNDKSTLHKVSIDICELTRESIIELKYKALEKQQDLLCDTHGHPVLVNIDKEKIVRVIGNLVANAIKFTPQNGAVEVIVSNHIDTVQIKVKDNGIGIPANLLPNLFSIFSGARRKGTANEQSYGLGLSISRQIVEDHGGTLTVSSVEGQGSTFTITLPA